LPRLVSLIEGRFVQRRPSCFVQHRRFILRPHADHKPFCRTELRAAQCVRATLQIEKLIDISRRNSSMPSWGERKDEVRSRIDALGGVGKIVGRCGHDVGQKFLRIAVVEGKPSALNLYLNTMALEKCVIGSVEAEAILENFIGANGFRMFEALAVTATEDLRVDDELIAGHVRLNSR
jgi:hypothetical protein